MESVLDALFVPHRFCFVVVLFVLFFVGFSAELRRQDVRYFIKVIFILLHP